MPSPRQQIVLNILFDSGWHSVREFLLGGTGVDYRARISELRKQGYEFEHRCVDLQDGQRGSEWRMVGIPGQCKGCGRIERYCVCETAMIYDTSGQGRWC